MITLYIKKNGLVGVYTPPGSWVHGLDTLNTHTHTHDRPRFDRGDRLANGGVLFDVDRAVDRSVPHRRLIGPIHHVDLDLNCSREDGVAAVLRHRLQPVALALAGKDQG